MIYYQLTQPVILQLSFQYKSIILPANTFYVYLSYVERLFMNLCLVCFQQRMAICVCTLMVVTQLCKKPAKQPAFEPVSFITCVNKPTLVIFSISKFSLGRGRNQQNHARFFYNIILINRLAYRYSLSLLPSVLLSRIFPTKECVCLNI